MFLIYALESGDIEINHELQLSNGGSLLVKVNWVPAESKSENPSKDIATQASG